MPKKISITFTSSALNDLQAVRTWYADQQAPKAGEKLLREIMSHAERLADFPESGRIVPEFGITNLREIIYSPFRIVYRLDIRKIMIIRVWRSERILKLP